MYVRVKNRDLLLRLSARQLASPPHEKVIDRVLLLKVGEAGNHSSIRSNSRKPTLTLLPGDAFAMIMYYLPYYEWFKFRVVNKEIAVIISSSENLWHHRFRKFFPKSRRRCFFLSSFEEARNFEASKYFTKKCWRHVYDQQRYSSRLRSVIYSLNGPASDDAIIQFENKIGIFLPYQFLNSLRLHNGQHSKNVKVLDNISLLSLNEIDAYYEYLMNIDSSRYKFKLPVGAGTSYDQQFLYIDLEVSNAHPIFLCSPLGVTTHKVFHNWLSFIASIGE